MNRWCCVLVLMLGSTTALAAPGLYGDTGVTACVVPDGPWTAQLTWRAQKVAARSGQLQIGQHAFTACDQLPGPHPTALAVFGGHLYVGFRGAGLHRFDGTLFEPVEGLPVDGVRALAVYQDALWIGLGSRGIYTSQDGQRARKHHHWVLGRRGVTGMTVKAARLEIGMGPYGWWRVEGNRVRRVKKHVFAGCFDRNGPRAPVTECGLGPAPSVSGLPSGHVTALAHHQGHLYVGTFAGGLAIATGDGFSSIEGAPRFVNALLSDGDVLWVASPRGLFRLDRRGVRQAGLPLPSHHVNGLAQGPDGTLWVATSGGLAGFGSDGVREYRRHNGLPGRIVYAVAATADGAVWAGTDRGAARLSADGVTVFTQANGGVPHDWINALLADGDAVYAGTYDAGVVRLTADGRGRPVAGLESAWVNPAGLSFHGTRLTVATLGDGFLSVPRAGAGSAQSRTGLPSDDVTASIVHDGHLYIGTRGGLARIGPP